MLNLPFDFRTLVPISVVGGIFGGYASPNVKAVLLNVNTPDTRGSAMALFSLSDDIGKGTFSARLLAFPSSLISLLPSSPSSHSPESSPRPCHLDARVSFGGNPCLTPGEKTGLGPPLIGILITHFGRQKAFSIAACMWLWSGLLLLALSRTIVADEDSVARQV